MSPSRACLHCGRPLGATAKLCPECGTPTATVVPISIPPLTKGGRGHRLIAALFDLTLLSATFAVIIRMAPRPWWCILCWVVYVEIGYYCGGSLGKLLLGLRIDGLTRRVHYFRETIGKLASTATFGVGFALILAKDRLAMHDYMARTRVCNRPAPFKGSPVLAFLVMGALIGPFAYQRIATRQPGTPGNPQIAADDFVRQVTRHIAAVGTVYTYGKTGAAIGQGSAFVLTAEGLAATNVHVLEGAFRADCRLGDGRLYEVLAIQGFDASEDVVLFQLGRSIQGRLELPSSLPAVTLGSAATVRIGDRVATISSPKGLSNTVSDGLVSSIREEDGRPFIQTTAPISPGSSGAPLFNTKAEVIGLTTLQLRDGQNLNFAVPIEDVANLIQKREELSLPDFQARLAPQRPTSAARPVPTGRSAPVGRATLTMREAFQQADAAFQARQYAEALKGYERVQELAPTQAPAYYNAALCYVQLGDSAKAARMYYIFLLLADERDPDRQRVIDWLAARSYPIPKK